MRRRLSPGLLLSFEMPSEKRLHLFSRLSYTKPGGLSSVFFVAPGGRGYVSTRRSACGRLPSSDPGFARPTFPLGEGSVRVVPPKKPSPGGKVAAKQTDEGYVPPQNRSVPRQHGTTRNHPSDPVAKGGHLRGRLCQGGTTKKAFPWGAMSST